jgi:REP element-mobilizing transposase RayT
MPRQSRSFTPNTIYHVTNRGVERRPIYRTDEDRRRFMAVMRKALREAGCGLLAYCLMGNHFHFLVAVAERALGVPMHKGLTEYAMGFNSSNDRTGHLFQSRYFSRPVFDPAYLHNVIAYIHRNPVEAGLVPTVDKWPWSSHHEWVSQAGATLDLSRLEELCGMAPDELRTEYVSRVAFMASNGPRILSVRELVRDTASMLGIDPKAIESGARGAVYTEARMLIAKRAAAAGHPDVELARALNCTRAAISQLRSRHGLDFGAVVNERDCPSR